MDDLERQLREAREMAMKILEEADAEEQKDDDPAEFAAAATEVAKAMKQVLQVEQDEGAPDSKKA